VTCNCVAPASIIIPHHQTCPTVEWSTNALRYSDEVKKEKKEERDGTAAAYATTLTSCCHEWTLSDVDEM
jgi:hypothetical protein